MKTIWKYELDFAELTTITMPKNAEILTVQRDEKTSKPCIWVMVDTDNETEERVFQLFGTGYEVKHYFGCTVKYIGTYQYQKGEFVGHVFEQFD